MFSSFRIRSISLAAALLATAGAAQADYLWLSRDGAAAAARVGELDKTPQPAASVTAPRAFLADGKDLPLTVEADRVRIPGAAAGTDLRAVASRVTGENTLTQYQARWGRTETKAVNDLELVPTEPNGNTFKLVWKGNTVAASQVNVDTAEGWRRVLKPAKDGTVTLTTPFPGLYVLEVTARVNGAVTVDGKKYEEVRHTATLSFDVPR
ncbi:hypothetical protein [Variovorax sp. PAMC26660]|uniref:hypothetical protein n=1 Tax=Variovorax sp. PAMC26660 TaxID=2762322 RepID=UPI00164CEC42|nr:hypothetical protein [Variovorax sp. PAMC26660]QNK69174.1 hypothetical protein H7F35_05525 [Variovorax sp. PAMC26660]